MCSTMPLFDTTLLTNAPGEPRLGGQILTEIESVQVEPSKARSWSVCPHCALWDAPNCVQVGSPT